jgi:hypothetical protein
VLPHSKIAGDVRSNSVIGGVWMYWILGTYDADVDTLSLTTGLLRSCESLGSSFSYAVGAVSSATLMTNLIVAAVTFFVSVPTTTWAAWLVPDEPETVLYDEEESEASVTRVDEVGKA